MEVILKSVALQLLHSILSEDAFVLTSHHAGNRLFLVDGNSALGDHIVGDRLLIEPDLKNALVLASRLGLTYGSTTFFANMIITPFS